MARNAKQTEDDSKSNGIALEIIGGRTETEPGEIDTSDPRSVETLFEFFQAQPAAYRPVAQVFRTTEDAKQRQGGWVCDIPCESLPDARILISKNQDGGRGIYQIVLMDSITGKRAKIAYLRIDATTREREVETPAGDTAALSLLRERTQEDSRRIRELEARLSTTATPRGTENIDALLDRIDKLNRSIDDERERSRHKQDEAYEAGFKRGKQLGEAEGKLDAKIELMSKHKPSKDDDGWKPQDIKSVIKEVGSIFNSGGKEKGSEAFDENISILDMLKRAFAIGVSAKNTIEMIRTLRGGDYVGKLAGYLSQYAGEIMADPEVIALIKERPDAKEWLDVLVSELMSGVASRDG